MKTGEIVLIPFPFAELTNKKVRPAIVICETKDFYKDIVVCAISSVVPKNFTENEMLLKKDAVNNLRVDSVAKIDRIVTAKRNDIIAALGKLSKKDLENFKKKFKNLIDS
jgi:mRNA interferase MazF